MPRRTLAGRVQASSLSEPAISPSIVRPKKIDHDIAIMKRAGFNVVRMGDLSWDSFEPAQGQFKFEWFDKIMDKMQANGIKVILDIPGTPAPIWLHRKYPGVDIVNQNGDAAPAGRTLYG